MKRVVGTWLLTLIGTSFFSQTLNVKTYYNTSTKAITVVDAINTYTIQHSDKRKPWVAGTGTPNQSIIIPVISIATVHNGYDVTYLFQNSSTAVSAIGNFYISGLRLDSVLSVRDFAVVGAEDTINSHDTAYFAGGSVYPSNLYSPLAVIGDRSYTIGISFMYPVTQYKHELFMRSQVPDSVNGGPAWELLMETNKEANGAHYYDYGDIQPGEERTYKIAVRFAYRNDQCQPWLTTVAPYKKYFNENYGYTTYNRDSTPIMGLVTAITSALHQTNPYGFGSGSYLRPDIYGFESLVDHFINKGDVNESKNMMLWTPTGMYLNQTSLNYPFKFTTHWAEGDPTKYSGSYGHNMGNASQQLRRVPLSSEGRQLGLWWGRASTVMYDWDDSVFVKLNPAISTHTIAACRELDTAVAAGATLIGLDAFCNNEPLWWAYDWLKLMRKRAPQVKFAVEQGGADILHTLSASFYYSELLKCAPYLANYLLPGNEIWSLVRESKIDTTCEAEIQRVAQLGYRPIYYCNGNMNAYNATESWHQTNPYPDLGPNVTIESGDTLVLNAAHANAATFIWSTGATTSTITVTRTGNYVVNSTNIFGCSYSDSVVVSTLSPHITSVDFTYTHPCSSDSISFQSSVTPDAPPHVYAWEFGDGGGHISSLASPRFIYPSPGTYTVSLTVSNNISQQSILKAITVHSSPTVSIITNDNLTLCSGDSLALIANSSESGYYWSTGQTASAIYVSAGGIYMLIISNQYDCIDTASIEISETGNSLITVSGDLFICEGNNSILSASGADNYVWNSSANTTISTGATIAITPQASSTYSVSGMVQGCATQTVFTVMVDKDLPLNIAGEMEICAGEQTTLTALGENNYIWQPLDGLSSSTGYIVILAPEETSNYIVSESDGCMNSMGFTIIVTTCGVNIAEAGQKVNSFLYPNPATDQLFIKFPATISEDVEIKIMNTNGQVVKLQKTTISSKPQLFMFSINDLTPGMYIIRIITTSTSFAERWIKH